MMLSSKSGGDNLNELVLENQIEQQHLAQQQKCHSFISQFRDKLKNIDNQEQAKGSS